MEEKYTIAVFRGGSKVSDVVVDADTAIQVLGMMLRTVGLRTEERQTIAAAPIKLEREVVRKERKVRACGSCGKVGHSRPTCTAGKIEKAPTMGRSWGAKGRSRKSDDEAPGGGVDGEMPEGIEPEFSEEDDD